ncbi:methyltransferase [Geobacter sp. FeAm09]|uniref:MGMT family protein n=1 Tax=Geobacter sp. FeAm09 TaxID=2597769 RepID=UPI0011EEABD7|nr:MGMT family protein [Geobacter sp. FeAm09]QEM68722.1 methyltransferase [Geobacter sp. FeAm09]
MQPDITAHQKIYSVVSLIPAGCVATYGQVACLAGMPGHARLVGYALSALHDRVPVPWHRVVNARGLISPRSGGNPADMVQRLRLESEGVSFDGRGRIPLAKFQWHPRPGDREDEGLPGDSPSPVQGRTSPDRGRGTAR